MTTAEEESMGRSDRRSREEKERKRLLGWLVPVCNFHTCTGIAPSLRTTSSSPAAVPHRIFSDRKTFPRNGYSERL